MFGKHSQFNGWDLAGAEQAPGFFDDLDHMLQMPVNKVKTGTPESSKTSPAPSSFLPILDQPLFTATFELLPEGAVFVSCEGKISRVNDQALGILNQIEERVLGTEFTNLISESDPLKATELDDLFEHDLTSNLLMTLRVGRNDEVFISLNARRLYCEETLRCAGYLITMQEFV